MLENFLEDLNIIQKLGDFPNTDDSLSPEQLKERFDQAGNLIKKYLNEKVVPAIEEATNSMIVHLTQNGPQYTADRTIAEIQEFYAAGKMVYLLYQNIPFVLTIKSSPGGGTYAFKQLFETEIATKAGGGSNGYYEITFNGGTWKVSAAGIPHSTDTVTRDATKLPTALAVYDFVVDAVANAFAGSGVGSLVPSVRTINGKPLSDDITLNYTDVGAAPSSHSHDYVPTSRTINGKALTSDISLVASDVGASPSGHTHDGRYLKNSSTYDDPNVDISTTNGSYVSARTSGTADGNWANIVQFQSENFKSQLAMAVNPSSSGTRSAAAWLRDRHGTSAWSAWSEILVHNRDQTITGAKTFVSSNTFDGEQKYYNTQYCPTIEDTAGGVGCAFKASRGLYNEALLDKIIMTATTGKIPFYKYTGTSGGNMTGLTEVASIDANGALSCASGTVSGALKVSGTSTLGRIDASNEYLTGSLYVGGKSSTSDGKTGVAFGAKGNVTMQGESAPTLSLIVGSETSAKAKISASSNGILNLIGKTKVAFNTGSAEVAAIDSNGKLVCGDIAAANITGTSIGSSTLNFTNQFNLTNTAISKGLKFFATCLSPDENSAGITLGQSNYRFGTIYTNTAVNTSSDRNLKTDIQPIDERYVNLFDKLEPVSYKLKGDNHDRDHLGFISQDIWAAMGEVGISDMEFGGFCRDAKTKEIFDEETGEVTGTEPVLDENGEQEYTYSLRYGEFIALNSKMIQLCRETIKEQQTEIERLTDRISQLEQKLNTLFKEE